MFLYCYKISKNLPLSSLHIQLSELIYSSSYRFSIERLSALLFLCSRLSISLNSWKDYFWGEEYMLPENFGITKEGLYFLYNPYEAAPYAAGSTEYIIPFEALKNIIQAKVLEQMKE